MKITTSSKLASFALAFAINSFIMGAVGYLFETRSHPHMSGSYSPSTNSEPSEAAPSG